MKDQVIQSIVTIAAKSWNTKQSHAPAKEKLEFKASEHEFIIEVNYAMGKDVLLWDEFSPAGYVERTLLPEDNIESNHPHYHQTTGEFYFWRGFYFNTLTNRQFSRFV